MLGSATVDAQLPADAALSPPLPLHQVWSVRVVPPRHKLEAVAAADPSACARRVPCSLGAHADAPLPAADRVVVSAEAAGDGGVLVKYLNPHLIAVATACREPEQACAAPGLQLLAVDGVSGRVLLRRAIATGSGPVALAVSENLLLCTYWNHKVRAGRARARFGLCHWCALRC